MSTPTTPTDSGHTPKDDSISAPIFKGCTRKRASVVTIKWTHPDASVKEFLVEVNHNDKEFKYSTVFGKGEFEFIPYLLGLYTFRIIPKKNGSYGKEILDSYVHTRWIMWWSRIRLALFILAAIAIVPLFFYARDKYETRVIKAEEEKILAEIEKELRQSEAGSTNTSTILPSTPQHGSNLVVTKPGWQAPTNPPAPPPPAHEDQSYAVIQPPRSTELRPAERISLSRPEPAEDWEVATKSITAPPADFIITNEVTYVIIKPSKSVAVNVSRQKLLEHTYHANLLVWWDGIEAPAPNKDGIRRFRMSDRPEVVILKNNGESDAYITFVWRTLQKPF